MINRGKHINKNKDLYYTPLFPLDQLLPIIPKDFVIWECCNGSGNISSFFETNGFKVLKTDINMGLDFLIFEPKEHYDIIITNPPFSIKNKIIKRCYDLKKPFLLLCPINVLESRKRYKMFKDNGISYFHLNGRVDYINAENPEKKSRSPFYSIWIGKDIPNFNNNTINFL